MKRCITKFLLLLAFGVAFPVLAADQSQVDADGCTMSDSSCHEMAAMAKVFIKGIRPIFDPCSADDGCQHGRPPSPGPLDNVLPPNQPGPGAGSTASAQSTGNTDTKDACEAGKQVPEPNPHGLHPVIFATGEKFLHEQDFGSASYYGLHLTRTYRSKQAVGTLFGPNWVTDMETPPLQGINGCSVAGNYGGCGPSSVTVIGDDGAAKNFNYYNQSGNQYVYQGSSGGWLIYIPGNRWVYQKTANDIYYYNLSGYITSFSSSVTGVSNTYTYLPQTNRLNKITNAVGQSITFTWGSNNRVARVTDPNGNNWTYEYNGNGMLTRVLSPGTSGDSREYYYEDARPTLLTGVATNGVRYSTYSYYPDGRVQRSGRTNGELVDNFTYGTNTTTLTNEMGASSTFTFTSIAGGRKLTSISKATTSTCSAAAAATT